jgi:integrase
MPRVNVDFVPSYRKHKPTGQAVVTLNGKDHYLGHYGTAASRAEYDRLIAEWLACDRQLPDEAGRRTINELILDYLRHAYKYYRRPDGTPTAEVGCLKLALRALRKLYGGIDADAFGPSQLRTVRDAMIGYGWVRRSINLHLSRLKHLFRWAGEHGLVKPEAYHGLLCVSGLRGGRSDAKESVPVKPVPEPFVEAVKPVVSPHVRAMIELQALTGMRPGEVCTMRGRYLETGGKVWVYRPEAHKTEWHGHKREVYLGPRAQEVLKPWLRANLDDCLFQPAEAMAWKLAEQRKSRKTPLWPSHIVAKAARRKRQGRRHFLGHFTVNAYRAAIQRACQQANIPAWHPHQLRHNAATTLRREHGVELARIILGHATAFTTEIYAEADRAQAMEVIAKVG